jgi:hypothetical protein
MTTKQERKERKRKKKVVWNLDKGKAFNSIMEVLSEMPVG